MRDIGLGHALSSESFNNLLQRHFNAYLGQYPCWTKFPYRPSKSDPEKYGITLADSDDEALKVLNNAKDVAVEESEDEISGKLLESSNLDLVFFLEKTYLPILGPT